MWMPKALQSLPVIGKCYLIMKQSDADHRLYAFEILKSVEDCH